MTAASLAFRTILSHYLPGLLALPGVYGLVALIFRASGQPVLPGDLLCWISKNPGVASFGILALPLFLGILLDTARHGFWPMREDRRWPQNAEQHLSQLPEFLYRSAYDEYYYYTEFEGNSTLAGFVNIPMVLYTFITYGRIWGFSVLAGTALLTTLLGISWRRSLEEFFADLEDTAAGYEEALKRRAKYAKDP